MRRFSLALMGACLLVLGSGGWAHAQGGVPMQGPGVAPAGALVLVPSAGIITEDPITDIALFARGRYSLTDRISATARVGATLGDVDLFEIGADGKLLVIRDGESVPVDLATFGAIDLAFGDVDFALNLLGGPLVGKTIHAGALDISPYAGVGLGLAFADTTFGSDTELALGVILGTDVAFTSQLSGFTELTIGIGDALSTINWHFGVTYVFGGAPAAAPGEPAVAPPLPPTEPPKAPAPPPPS